MSQVHVGVRHILQIEQQKIFSLLPAGHTRSTQPAGPKITLRFPRLFVIYYIYIYIYLCIRTYHVRNSYVMYIVAM